MLAPDIYTLRDLRQQRVPPGRGHFRVVDDGIPTWRRETLMLMPRLPYRNAAFFARCGLKLFARYAERNGAPDLVQAHSILNAGVAALAIKRRYSIPFVVMEQSTAFAQGQLRWWSGTWCGWSSPGSSMHCREPSHRRPARRPVSRFPLGPPCRPTRRCFSRISPPARNAAAHRSFLSCPVLAGEGPPGDEACRGAGGDPDTRLRLAGTGRSALRQCVSRAASRRRSIFQVFDGAAGTGETQAAMR
jgi:hypothetical protein